MTVRQSIPSLEASVADATLTATLTAAPGDRGSEGPERSGTAQEPAWPAACSDQRLPADPAEPGSAFRRCLVVRVPRPWQGFRQAVAEHGSWACQEPQGRPPQPGHRLYRTSYP